MTTSATPLISIGMPAYKTVYLREAIRSVLAQDFADWELIIVDDCSPEPVGEVVRECTDDPRVHYYRNERNLGGFDPAVNWNKCLSYAQGKYFCLLCDDDMYEPWCLSTMLALAERYPACHTFRMRSRCINEQGETFDYYPSSPEWETAVDYVWHFEKGWRLQAVTEWMYVTDHMRQTGGYEALPKAWGSDYLSVFKFAIDGGIASTARITCVNRASRYQITQNIARYVRTNIQARNLYEERMQQLFGQDPDYKALVAPHVGEFHDRYMTRELVWCSWGDWCYLLRHRDQNRLSLRCFKQSIGRKIAYQLSQLKRRLLRS